MDFSSSGRQESIDTGLERSRALRTLPGRQSKWLAFAHNYAEGNADIYKVARMVDHLTKLTSGRCTKGNPVWTASGRWIAFWNRGL